MSFRSRRKLVVLGPQPRIAGHQTLQSFVQLAVFLYKNNQQFGAYNIAWQRYMSFLRTLVQVDPGVQRIYYYKAKAGLWLACPRIGSQGIALHAGPARFGGPRLTCFGHKNVTSLTGGPNRPPLVQKTLRH